MTPTEYVKAQPELRFDLRPENFSWAALVAATGWGI